MRIRARHIPTLTLVALVVASCQGDPPVGPSARPRPGGPVPVTVTISTPTAAPTATATATATARATAAPTGTATATATATAAPTMAPTAPADSDGPLQPGPVRFLTLRVLSVRADDTFRPGPYMDADGNQVMNYGEVIVFDLTPRNAANKPCEAEGVPEWTVQDNQDAANRDYLAVLNSSNPYLLRVRAVGRTGKGGRVHLWAEVDGVPSNHLWVVVK